MTNLEGGISKQLGNLAKAALQAYAHIRCPRCKAPIVPSDLNLSRIFIGCRSCGIRFDYSTQVVPENDVTPRLGEPVEKPSGIEVSEEEDEFDLSSKRDETTPRGRLTIVRRWSRRMGIVALVFALLWNGITTFAFISGAALEVLTALLGVGIPMTYIAVALVINHTTITVDRNALTLRHGPLPWWGQRKIPSRDIFRLYCRRMTVNDDDENIFDNSKESFLVDVATRDGKRRAILSSLPTWAQAAYIYQRIMQHLRIEEGRVEAEPQ